MNSAAAGIDYDEGKCISTEMANEMSLFYAEATPMLKTLSDATTRFVQEVGFMFHAKVFGKCVKFCLLLSVCRTLM